MKMRVHKKINWMKRMVATGMAVCMVLTTPASALAGAEEGTETQTISEEAAGTCSGERTPRGNENIREKICGL